jgi:formate-dependent phosphoribosylglycinamide formyltransferase (GAR transformylase)
VIEPDADADGYGDETQDLCPTVAEVQAPPCAAPDKTAPETTITKAPKRKTKSKQATFEFRSSEPDSTFQCSLDGAGFADCISPRILIAGKGKHVFQVRQATRPATKMAHPRARPGR